LEEGREGGVPDTLEGGIVFFLDLDIFGSEDFGNVVISGLLTTLDF
jgi:hypothetical protein